MNYISTNLQWKHRLCWAKSSVAEFGASSKSRLKKIVEISDSARTRFDFTVERKSEWILGKHGYATGLLLGANSGCWL